ncbi:T9SS type B sorting domain-containing protein [Pinibacter aurantiacus]|uniref:Gliding motility-associated C-terminal domain-containing protein n=1 Tax=Pinibacter aurantiacus TaxID=2851599 RepID=A0A9E2S9R3_9BACT|nr:gliding motility-associated C-terminal domain-containing protein [Pinibacter aurantiacus]MBV4358182.1 gliding motility-associated C-terminal domain-containing protein [Pinibacter aurantiacus]
MRTKYAFLFCVFFLLFIAPRVFAQDFTVGTGSVGNDSATFPSPLPANFEGSRSQYLFRASELQAAGLTRGFITALKFNVTKLNGAGNLTQYSLKMDTTSVTSLKATTWEPSPTQYYTTTRLTPVLGVNTITFPNKYFWNGTSNILIEICVNGGTLLGPNQTYNPTVAWTTGLSFNASHTYGANDISSFCTINTTTEIGTATTRPNITFAWTAAPPDCAGKPTAGSVSSTKTLVCPNDKFFLSATYPAALGLTYQWQYSTNNVAWNNLAGATKDTVTTSLTTDTYYRLTMTCTASGKSDTSTSVLVNKIPGVSGTFTIDNTLTTNASLGVFKTFNDAYNYISCGISGPVVFNVAKNVTPYTEQLVMNNVFGTSATNTITFNGNGATINYNATTTATAPVIKLNGTDHVIIDSLNITALSTSTAGWGIHLTNDADSNTIRRCTISVNSVSTSSAFAGIVISGGTSASSSGSYCDSNTIANNTIIGGFYGISMQGGTSTGTDYPIARNQIINNNIREFLTYGITANNSLLGRIEGNDLSRPTRASVSTSAMYGIVLSGPNMGNAISRNKIHNIYGASASYSLPFYGIYLSNAKGDVGLENVVSNNMIYDIKNLGTLYGLYNSGSNYANFYYNTVVFEDPLSASINPTYGFYATFQSVLVEVKNNIFSISRGGVGTKFAICLPDNTISMFTIDNNNYFNSGQTTYNQGYYFNKIIASLSDWQAITKYDASSVGIDPAFKDAANGDFTPTSAALGNRGAPVAITTDINTIARDAAKPDMGAIEYALAGCTTAFNAGDAFSNVGYATCTGKSVLLNLKNNDVGSGLTYQWQTATSLAGTWSNLSTALVSPPYTFNANNATLYYRAAVACNGGTPQYTVPLQITIGGHFPGGTYTIDKTQPTDPAGTKNFNSFKDAASAISCGIDGPVVFNVKPGVYNEQIRIATIANSSAINTVTFQSENGNAASAELTYNATTVGTNYTVQLDSASYINFKNLTISSTNILYGRTFDLANMASNDSIVNCVINSMLPDPTNYATFGADQTTTAGIFAGTAITKGNFVIKGNTFHRGSKGVYIAGFTTSVPVSTTYYSPNNVIEGNIFDSAYQQSIYVLNTANIKVSNNIVPVATKYGGTVSANQATYGIYMNNCDSAITVTGNKVTFDNTTGYIYGMYLTNNNATATARGKIMNNKIYGLNGLTNHAVGLYNGANSGNTTSYEDVVNNEISVNSSVAGTSNSQFAAALWSYNASSTNYYNNTLLNSSPKTGFYNVAVWLDHQSYNLAGNTNIFNNIIANKGGGPAMFINYTTQHLNVDYNLYYSSGTMLIKRGPANNVNEMAFNDIASWRPIFGQDNYSIVYNPALTSTTDLSPVASDANSWAMQGRGKQLAGNTTDINGNPRPVALTDGVPDLGAYEFEPTVAPPNMVATPATPEPGITQTFSFGSDTVTRITWDPNTAVPSSITLKRYSGKLPAGLDPTEKSMYYYVDADATGAGPFKYKMQQFYLEPWLRNVPAESFIKTGQTDASNKWNVSASTVIDTINNLYSDSLLVFLDKFTGMTDGKAPVPPAVVTAADSLNAGTRFWAPYAQYKDFFQGDAQQLKFVLSSNVATQVTMSVYGTSFVKTYSIPAGGSITTDEIPRFGINDARLMGEGLYSRAVLIESTKPITAMLSLGAGQGATNSMLMPTGTYSKDYTTLGLRQIFGTMPSIITASSWVNVVADANNTVVEITPSNPTLGGKAAGVPFRVTLNRGQVYQILGAFKTIHTPAELGNSSTSYEYYDLTGTKVVAVPNSDGNCLPIGVFTGNAGTTVRCTNDPGGDSYVFQQSYPMQAWGKRFLTAPLATANGQKEMLFNLFRVLVKDPATVVKRNGVKMTGMLPGNVYEFTTRDPQYFEADKPIMVSQSCTYFNACGNDEYNAPGSPETAVYLTPVGLGVDSAMFARKTGGPNYVTAIVPKGAVGSLKIDGSNTFDTSYTHPQNAAYTVVMKRWSAANAVSVITCDSNFTATVHQAFNFGFVYNIGFQVPRIDPKLYIDNHYNDTTVHNTYACANNKFKPTLYLPMPAKSLTWKLSAVKGLVTSAADVTVNNPVAADTVEINSQDYYLYPLNQELAFSNTGIDSIPVSVTYAPANPVSCDQTVTNNVVVVVKQAPKADFTNVYDNCVFTTAQFTATGTVYNGAAFDRWNWNFGDNTTATGKTPTKKWNQSGSFNVGLLAISDDGCYDSTSQKIVVNSCDNIFIPNSFTPNGDGHNDQFKLYAGNVKEMKMMIFNQWGQKIFETTNMANGWDGTLNGKPMPSGVYMYVCRIILTSGDIVDKKGSINLLR